MSDLQPIALLLAAIISAVYGVLHGNLGALFHLVTPLQKLQGIHLGNFLSDVMKLSPEDRASLEAQFDAAVSIPDPAAATKVGTGAHAMNQAIEIAQRLLTDYALIVSFTDNLKVVFQQSAAHLVGLPAAERFAISIPGMPAWLTIVVKGALINLIAPALETAFPAEAPLIQAFAAFIAGNLSAKEFHLAMSQKPSRSRYAPQEVKIDPPTEG